KVGPQAFGDDLVEARLSPQVLQLVRAEVAQLGPRRKLIDDKVACRPGDQDLATVTRGGDARGPVNVDADVPPAGEERLSRVKAHAHAHLRAFWPPPIREGVLRLDG